MAEQTPPTRLDTIARTIAVVVGAAFVLFGLFAFFAPQPFYESFAAFEPYNEHFVRDIGAFQIGLGAILVLAAFTDGLLAALAGAGLGAAFHLASHVVDRDAGGDPATDIPVFTIMAIALLAGAVARAIAAQRRR